MLSISRAAIIAKLIVDYFFRYMEAGGDSPGRWFGLGAAMLGLAGDVSKKAMELLCSGYAPDGSELVQNAGKTGPKGRRCGWDLVVTAPKPYSILERLCPHLREDLLALRRRATDAMLAYLEENAAFARLGKAGERLERVRLVVARFEHFTSRENDPNVHEHCFVFNVGILKDGSAAALWSHPLYRHQRAARAVYWATLAAGLREMGIAVTPKKHGFDIVGVPPKIVKHFSKRREQILAELNAHGAQSAKAAEIANLATRRDKVSLPLAELEKKWQSEVRQLGLSLDRIERRVLASKPTTERRPLTELVNDAVAKLITQENSFVRRELVHRVAEASIEHGHDAAKVQRAIDHFLTKSPEAVKLADRDVGASYSTKAVLEQERSLLQDVTELAGRRAHVARQKTVDRVLNRTKIGKQLSQEQAAAVVHATRGTGDCAAITGVAGGGKTTALMATKLVLEREGFKVLGAAVTGVAARQLELHTGIKSDTLAMRLKQLSTTRMDRAIYAAKQALRGRSPKRKAESFKLDRKTILVLDEAGQASSHQLAELVAHVKKANAKIITVGGTDQLEAIERPGAFGHILKQIGSANLAESRRQTLKHDDQFREPDWQRTAGREFAEGKASQALERYAKRGFVKLGEDRRETISQLVKDWAVAGVKDPTNNAILVSTNRDAELVNKECQEARKAAGKLTLLHHAVEVAGRDIFTRDRVLFTKKSRTLGIENGDFGTVVSVDDERRRLAVKLNRGEVVNINLRKYDEVRPGYATTVHRRQGSTLTNVFYLCGSRMQDRSLTHVAATRATENTTFYVPRHEAGPDFKDIVKQMQSSRERVLAHALITDKQHDQEHNLHRKRSVLDRSR